MPNLLSPRFLALPVIVLAVIGGLAATSSRTITAGTQVAAPATLKAVSCANPVNRNDPACVVVRDDTRIVR